MNTALSRFLTCVPGIKLRYLGLSSKYFHLLSYLSGSSCSLSLLNNHVVARAIQMWGLNSSHPQHPHIILGRPMWSCVYNASSLGYVDLAKLLVSVSFSERSHLGKSRGASLRETPDICSLLKHTYIQYILTTHALVHTQPFIAHQKASETYSKIFSTALSHLLAIRPPVYLVNMLIYHCLFCDYRSSWSYLHPGTCHLVLFTEW